MGISFVTVRCPTCALIAEFEFANIIQITRKSNISYFENSKHFDVIDREGWSKYKLYYHAVHYPSISPRLENIKDLPENCGTDNWQKRASYPNIIHHKHYGTIQCNTCKSASKHQLEWPEEAFFQIGYKGKTLWAYDRETAIKLLGYIQSKDRRKRIELSPDYVVQDAFLRKIPEHFQTAKARDIIVKKLKKVLGL